MTALRRETHGLGLPHEIKPVALPEAFLLGRALGRVHSWTTRMWERWVCSSYLQMLRPADPPAVHTAEAEPPAACSQLEGLVAAGRYQCPPQQSRGTAVAPAGPDALGVALHPQRLPRAHRPDTQAQRGLLRFTQAGLWHSALLRKALNLPCCLCPRFSRLCWVTTGMKQKSR